MLTYHEALAAVIDGKDLSFQPIRENLAAGILPIASIESCLASLQETLRGKGEIGSQGEMLRRWWVETEDGEIVRHGFDQLKNLLENLDAGITPTRLSLFNPIDPAELEILPHRLLAQVRIESDGRLSLYGVLGETEIIEQLPCDIVEWSLFLVLLGAVTGRPLGNLTVGAERLFLKPGNLLRAKLEVASPRVPVPISVENSGSGLKGLLAVRSENLRVA